MLQYLGECFFCGQMKPATKYISLKAIPLPKDTKIPQALKDAGFLICPDCDNAQPFERKETVMLPFLEERNKVEAMLVKHPWPFTAQEREGRWVVVDAKGRSVEFEGHDVGCPDKVMVENFIETIWQLVMHDMDKGRMGLYEVVNGATGLANVRVYAWADTEEEALEMARISFQAAKASADDLKARLLFKAESAPFVTEPSDCGFNDG